jgi:hypothetical protein
VADIDATLMQKILHVPKRKRKSNIHNHGQTDIRPLRRISLPALNGHSSWAQSLQRSFHKADYGAWRSILSESMTAMLDITSTNAFIMDGPLFSNLAHFVENDVPSLCAIFNSWLSAQNADVYEGILGRRSFGLRKMRAIGNND